jgi:hypothetical protein
MQAIGDMLIRPAMSSPYDARWGNGPHDYSPVVARTPTRFFLDDHLTSRPSSSILVASLPTIHATSAPMFGMATILQLLLGVSPFLVSGVVLAPTASGRTLLLVVCFLVRLVVLGLLLLLPPLLQRIRTTSAARTVAVVVADVSSSVVVRGVVVRLCSLRELASNLF